MGSAACFAGTGAGGVLGWAAISRLGASGFAGAGTGRNGSGAMAAGFTEKYTIPHASRAPMANADTSFQSNFTRRLPNLLAHFLARSLIKRNRRPFRFQSRTVKIA